MFLESESLTNAPTRNGGRFINVQSQSYTIPFSQERNNEQLVLKHGPP